MPANDYGMLSLDDESPFAQDSSGEFEDESDHHSSTESNKENETVTETINAASMLLNKGVYGEEVLATSQLQKQQTDLDMTRLRPPHHRISANGDVHTRPTERSRTFQKNDTSPTWVNDGYVSSNPGSVPYIPFPSPPPPQNVTSSLSVDRNNGDSWYPQHPGPSMFPESWSPTSHVYFRSQPPHPNQNANYYGGMGPAVSRTTFSVAPTFTGSQSFPRQRTPTATSFPGGNGNPRHVTPTAPIAASRITAITPSGSSSGNVSRSDSAGQERIARFSRPTSLNGFEYASQSPTNPATRGVPTPDNIDGEDLSNLRTPSGVDNSELLAMSPLLGNSLFARRMQLDLLMKISGVYK